MIKQRNIKSMLYCNSSCYINVEDSPRYYCKGVIMVFGLNSNLYTVNLKNEIRVNMVNVCRNRKKRVSKELEFDEYGELIQSAKSIADSQRRARVAVVDCAILNEFDYFGTFTIDDIKCGDLRFNPYEMKRKIVGLLQNFKKMYAPDLLYLLVPELGEKNKRLHFHFLMKNIPDNCFCLNANKKLDLPYFSSRVGFVQVDRIGNDKCDKVNVAKYCSKYISKDNIRLGKHRYFKSKGLNNSIREKLGNVTLCCSVREWLEMNGFLPYYNKKSQCYALPVLVYNDLFENVIKPYIQEKNDSFLVRYGLSLLLYDTPCPFDCIE